MLKDQRDEGASHNHFLLSQLLSRKEAKILTPIYLITSSLHPVISFPVSSSWVLGMNVCTVTYWPVWQTNGHLCTLISRLVLFVRAQTKYHCKWCPQEEKTFAINARKIWRLTSCELETHFYVCTGLFYFSTALNCRNVYKSFPNFLHVLFLVIKYYIGNIISKVRN